jgi:hypothetical protein
MKTYRVTEKEYPFYIWWRRAETASKARMGVVLDMRELGGFGSVRECLRNLRVERAPEYDEYPSSIEDQRTHGYPLCPGRLPVSESGYPVRADAPALAAAEWNRVHAVGTKVRYWTGAREGAGKESVTRGPAGVLGCHTAVVWVENESSCIALSHVLAVES